MDPGPGIVCCLLAYAADPVELRAERNTGHLDTATFPQPVPGIPVTDPDSGGGCRSYAVGGCGIDHPKDTK